MSLIPDSPCSQLPLTVGLFQGYYTEANLSEATPLQLYEPGLYNCPEEFQISAWSFSPTSTDATLVSQQPFGSNNVTTLEAMWTQPATISIQLKGYWTGSNDTLVFHQFTPGVYTAVAENEWGGMQMISFNISSMTGTNSSTRSGTSLA
jgi:hypothetical protein